MINWFLAMLRKWPRKRRIREAETDRDAAKSKLDVAIERLDAVLIQHEDKAKDGER